MKDHRKREHVNAITAVAKKYGHTQQLRSHIHEAVLACIKEAENETNDHEGKQRAASSTVSN